MKLNRQVVGTTSLQRDIYGLVDQIPLDAITSVMRWMKDIPPSFELELHIESVTKVAGPSTLTVFISNSYLTAELRYDFEKDELRVVEVTMK